MWNWIESICSTGKSVKSRRWRVCQLMGRITVGCYWSMMQPETDQDLIRYPICHIHAFLNVIDIMRIQLKSLYVCLWSTCWVLKRFWGFCFFQQSDKLLNNTFLIICQFQLGWMHVLSSETHEASVCICLSYTVCHRLTEHTLRKKSCLTHSWAHRCLELVCVTLAKNKTPSSQRTRAVWDWG